MMLCNNLKEHHLRSSEDRRQD